MRKSRISDRERELQEYGMRMQKERERMEEVSRLVTERLTGNGGQCKEIYYSVTYGKGEDRQFRCVLEANHYGQSYHRTEHGMLFNAKGYAVTGNKIGMPLRLGCHDEGGRDLQNGTRKKQT